MKKTLMHGLVIIGFMLGPLTVWAGSITQNFNDFDQTTPETNPGLVTGTDGWTLNEMHILPEVETGVPPRSSPNSASFPDQEYSGVTADNSYIETPLLSNGVGNVSFFLHNAPGAGGPFSLELQISTNETGWATSQTIIIDNTNKSGWNAYTNSLDIYHPVRLRFFRDASDLADFSWLLIDDITITSPPATVLIHDHGIDPTAPQAGEPVTFFADLEPIGGASSLVAEVDWSAESASGSFELAFNAGSGLYEAAVPEGLPVLELINYTLEVTFTGFEALSPQTASGSFYYRNIDPESPYTGIQVKGDLTLPLDLVLDNYWIGITNVGVLTNTDIYFETENGTPTRWSDPDQASTDLPIFGPLEEGESSDIRIGSTETGALLFVFDETNSLYNIQQATYQSFNSSAWQSFSGSDMIEGWDVTRAQTVDDPTLAFDGHSLQFAETTLERSIVSPELPDGIGIIMFRYRNTDTTLLNPANFLVQVRTEGGPWITQKTMDNVRTPDYVFIRMPIDRTDLVQMRIRVPSGASSAQLLLDDIIITRPGPRVTISDLQHTPENPTIEQTVDVSVDIEAFLGATVTNVTLWFRAPGDGETVAASAYSMPITFNNFEGRETLHNFPALIKLTTGNTDNYDGFLDTDNGHDLRFWLDGAFEGAELEYEIESFDSNGTSHIWVKIPQLTHDTTIWATWGDPGYYNQPAYTTDGSVWSEGFRGVWHLNETEGSVHFDSTSYNHHGTRYFNTPTNGIYGTAQFFNGTDAYIDFGTDANLTDLSSFTIESWVKTDSEGGWYRQIIGNYGTDFNDPSGQNFFGLGWMQASPHPLGFVVRVGGSAGTSQLFDNDNTYHNGQWHHLVGIKQGSDLTLYVNGEEIATGTRIGNPFAGDGNNRMRMGRHYRDDQYSYGIFDAPRVSASVRSADWVWANYMNQGTSHNDFVQYGSITPLGATGLGTPYDPIPMANTSSNTWTGTVPRGQTGTMQYYVTVTYFNPASGAFEISHEPLGSPDNPATYTNTDVILGQQDFNDFAETTPEANPGLVTGTDGWTLNEIHILPELETGVPPRSSPNSASFPDQEYSGVTADNSYIETPLFSNGVGNVSFFLHNAPGAGGPFSLELQISTNETDWATSETMIIDNTGKSGWNAYTITLDMYHPVQLRFFRDASDLADFSWLLIDDITITYPPAFVQAHSYDMHPAYPSQTEPVSIYATIESATTYHPAFNIQGTIEYRVRPNLGNWSTWSNTARMQRYDNGLFIGNIPAYPNLTEIEYRIRADFRGYNDGIPGSNQSPMTFTSENFYYRIREFPSAYERIGISIDGVSPPDFVQQGEGQWEGFVRFTSPTSNPSFFITGDGFYDGSTISGITTFWGDSNQTGERYPLFGHATEGQGPITIPGEDIEGLFIIRFDENTGEYTVQLAAFQDFEAWPADSQFFAESYSAAVIEQIPQDFETWTPNDKKDHRFDNFETHWRPEDVLDYPDTWVITSDTKRDDPVNGFYVIENGGIIVTQLVSQAALLIPGGMVRTIDTTASKQDVGTVSFDLRAANPNAFEPVIYTGLDPTNQNIMITATIEATEIPVNADKDSLGFAYKSIIAGYTDDQNYYELRMVQHSPSERRLKLYEVIGGVETRRGELGNIKSGDITKKDTFSMMYFDDGSRFRIRAFFSGDNREISTEPTRIPDMKNRFGFNSFDASVAIEDVKVYAVTSTTYNTDNELPVSSFDSPDWDKSGGTWNVQDNRLTRPGYTGDPIDVRVEFKPEGGSYSEIATIEAVTHSNWRRYTINARQAQDGFIGVRYLTINPAGDYLMVDNIRKDAWRATESVAEDGWTAQHVWIDNIGKQGKGIEMRHSRVIGGNTVSQTVASPETLGGVAVIAFDYRAAPDAAGPISFEIQKQIEGSGAWQSTPLATVTNASAQDWVSYSLGISDRPTALSIRRIRIRNTTPGHDDGLQIDNIVVTAPPPIDDTTWWGYNALITDSRPDGIADPPDPWLFPQTGNQFGAFLNNSYTNNTGGVTNNQEAPFPSFIQSARMPDGVGEIRFQYRAWDETPSTLQIVAVASTNRLTPHDQWIILDEIEVDDTSWNTYSSIRYETQYRHVTFRLSPDVETVGRVALENILITSPIGAGVNMGNIRTIPEIPRYHEDVHVEIDITEEFLNPANLELELIYQMGTNNWGLFPSPTARSMEEVAGNNGMRTFRTIHPIPATDVIDEVVQFTTVATFEGLFADLNSPMTNRTFQNPPHYWPVNLNQNQVNQTPYYFAFSTLPGQVWINEFNVLDDVWAMNPVKQYIEIAGIANAQIGDWKVQVLSLNPPNFSTNANYEIPEDITLANNDGFGFYVIGNENITERNMELTETLPDSGGIQLLRPTGIIEHRISYDTAYGDESGEMMSNMDNSFEYVGFDEGDESPVFLTGTGSNITEFTWNYHAYMRSDYSHIGAVNEGQTLIPWPTGTNGPPVNGGYTGTVYIADFWRDGDHLYATIQTQAENLVPTPWYTTNLMGNPITWLEVPGHDYTQISTNYTVFFEPVEAPKVFYTISVIEE